VKFIANVFEECIEVLFEDLMLHTDEVAPLDGHIVQRYVELVHSIETLGFRNSIEHFSGSLVQFSEEVAHFVESVDFVGLDGLECFSLPSYLFVDPFHFGHQFTHFLHVGLVVEIEVYDNFST
jgi:hypothetical protein